MNEPKRIKDVFVYDNVTLEDLNTLLQQGIISNKEFLEITVNGKKVLKNDSIIFYKK